MGLHKLDDLDTTPSINIEDKKLPTKGIEAVTQSELKCPSCGREVIKIEGGVQPKKADMSTLFKVEGYLFCVPCRKILLADLNVLSEGETAIYVIHNHNKQLTEVIQKIEPAEYEFLSSYALGTVRKVEFAIKEKNGSGLF